MEGNASLFQALQKQDALPKKERKTEPYDVSLDTCQDQQEVDSRQNARKIRCPRKACGSLLMLPKVGHLVYRPRHYVSTFHETTSQIHNSQE